MKPFYKKFFWTLVIIINIFFNPVTLVIAWFSWGAPWLNHGQFYRKPTFQLELTETRVCNQPALGDISDIQQVASNLDPSDSVTWIVGDGGALKVDVTWRKQSQVKFQIEGYRNNILLRSPDSQKFKFYIPEGAALLDAKGKTIWNTGTNYFNSRYTVGDINGDGHNEFIHRYNPLDTGSSSLAVLNDEGKQLWSFNNDERSFNDDILFDMEALVDTDKDNIPEIIEEDHNQFIFRDMHGVIKRKVHMPVDMHQFELCHWPTAESQLRITQHSENAVVWVLDYNGKILARYYMPDEFKGHTYGLPATPVVLVPHERQYFAVIASRFTSTLLIYDSHGAIVYAGRTHGDCNFIKAVPSTQQKGAEDLLIGENNGVVLRYSFKDKKPVK